MEKEQRLIDANALKDRWTIPSPEPINTDAAEVLESIDEQPTVDAVPVVHGRFVDAECSVCRWFGNIVETRHYNYCPNCGAKMDGDGNGTTKD